MIYGLYTRSYHTKVFLFISTHHDLHHHQMYVNMCYIRCNALLTYIHTLCTGRTNICRKRDTYISGIGRYLTTDQRQPTLSCAVEMLMNAHIYMQREKATGKVVIHCISVESSAGESNGGSRILYACVCVHGIHTCNRVSCVSVYQRLCTCNSVLSSLHLPAVHTLLMQLGNASKGDAVQHSAFPLQHSDT